MQFHQRVALALLSLSVVARPSCANNLSASVFAAIDSRDEGLRTVNTEVIFENPEIGYEEVHAHKILTDYLEEQGFKVTRGAYNISTAFRAEFSNGEGGRAVSFNSEYDALPGLGHACGHNLIATVGVAAAIGVKEALENGGVEGTVVLLGTPAEEGGGGKVKLLEAGAYDNLDCSLMAHPTNTFYSAYGRTLASWRASVAWKGATAHAAAAPWEGRNALDGFVAAYQMAGLLRQQLQPSDRIHHVVQGPSGMVANVIPDLVESQWGVRGVSRPRRDRVLEQVLSILYASSNATNTTVDIAPFQDYWDQNPSFRLTETFYKLQIEHFDPAEDPETAEFSLSTPEEAQKDDTATASSDQGNVSWFLPAIQAMFPIGGTAPFHNSGFRDVAKTDFAHKQAIRTAKILALTGLEVLRNETYAKAMWEEWEAMIEEIST
ncbi:Peptidase M20 domain-containing protein 2 [Paramyrothecium foliicola]|nr:Peptidase M20 domain-containing protein 2 [Paramyrothecium foliicola]